LLNNKERDELSTRSRRLDVWLKDRQSRRKRHFSWCIAI
jgi:hypothetical protein